MGRQARKHERSGSQPKADAGLPLPPKKPRVSDRPLGSAPLAPTPTPTTAPAPEPPSRDEVRRTARNSSAAPGGRPGLHGSRGPGGALEPSDYCRKPLLRDDLKNRIRDQVLQQLSSYFSSKLQNSDGLSCSTPDSTIAMLQQDDYEKGEYSSGVVQSKSGDSAVKIAATDVKDLPVEDLKDNEGVTMDSEAPSEPVPSIPSSFYTGDSAVKIAATDAVEDLKDNEGVTMDSEAPSEPVPSIPLVQDEEAVQLAKTLVNERVKEFMEGISEPEVLQSRLSKITSLLVQATSIAAILHDEIPVQKSAQTAALVTRVSELEQQVEELSKKLCSTEEKLEVTKVILKETQADMLEAQSDRATAITAMNSLAMRVGAAFARLGTILEPPPNMVDSLEESIKQMTALVSLIGPVSYSHGSSLARSSLTFGVAALLCRERGIEGMREPLAMDTRQFVRSQGREFQSLISQVVDSMEQQLAKTLQGCGWRDSGATKERGEPTDSKKGKMPDLH